MNRRQQVSMKSTVIVTAQDGSVNNASVMITLRDVHAHLILPPHSNPTHGRRANQEAACTDIMLRPPRHASASMGP